MAEMKDVFAKAEDKMKKAISHLEEEYAAIRAGRANPSVLKLIEKAIQTSDLGINPQNDGKVIRLIFPPLNEERRRELTKDTAKLAEEAKVAVRAIRRDAIEKLKDMKKKSEITEDDLKQAEKKTQDLTDKYVKNADACAAGKEKEILEI